MKHRLVLLSLAVLLLGQLVAMPAGACEKTEDCNVDRSCEKTETGIRCTLKAAGDDLEKVRRCANACKENCTMDGVTVTVEETDEGIVVTRTATDPEIVKKLQAHAKACCHHHAGHKGAGHKGCDKKAAHAHHDHGDHEKQAKKPCDKPCTTPCTHG